MSTDPRVALDALVTALERHLEACAGKRSDNDPAIDSAYLHLADAYEAYDDALFAAYDETTPLLLDTEEDDDFEDEDDDFDEDQDDGDDEDDYEVYDEDLELDDEGSGDGGSGSDR